MKLFTGSLAAGSLAAGSLAAGLILLASGALAQSPYATVSDIGGPYAAMPPGPEPVPGPHYGYGPSLLPSTEVYAVLRDNGFSPLGIPRLRGFVYTIAVIDRGGEDGRLVIDARDGRIIRFVPAYRMSGVFHEGPRVMYGAPPAPLPPDLRSSVHPPRATGKVASHSVVPVPKAKPLAAREPAKSAAEPVKQATAPQPKPAEVQAAAPPAVTTGSASAKPAPQIAPTQELPTAQGLE
ncbi:MAG: hypothetical protein PS018_00850 [bacterium]|nr:hypothetical protein [bacterium]